MQRVSPPKPQVIGGRPNKHSGTGNKPINRIVIHSAVMPCEPGMARRLGDMNKTSETGSWHYAVDPEETFQCSFDSYVCWHAPPNPHSLGIEMADNPGRRPVGQTIRVWRWAGRNHRRMLRRTARLTARACLAYDVPIRFLTVADLKAGRRGITTHHNVSLAFRESSHWDPGWWPRRRFMRQVRREANRIRKVGRR